MKRKYFISPYGKFYFRDEEEYKEPKIQVGWEPGLNYRFGITYNSISIVATGSDSVTLPDGSKYIMGIDPVPKNGRSYSGYYTYMLSECGIIVRNPMGCGELILTPPTGIALGEPELYKLTDVKYMTKEEIQQEYPLDYLEDASKPQEYKEPTFFD